MRSKRSQSLALQNIAATSRREFLRYGGAVVGASIIASAWPRRANAQTAAFDYYISTTGNDSNPGTLAAPWALTSLLHSNANNSKMAGKRTGLIGGTTASPVTYAVGTLTGVTSTYPVGDYETAYLQLPGGTSSSQTYLAPCNSSGVYTQGAVTLDFQYPTILPPGGTGNGFTAVGSIAGATASSYITIDGLNITNAYYRGIAIGAQTGGYFTVTNRAHGVVVQNNYISNISNSEGGANASAITLYATSGSLVHNNYIYNVADSANRGSAIELWNTDTSVVEYNTVISGTTLTMAAGILIKNQGLYQNTVRYNYVDLSRSGTGSVDGGAFTFDLSGTSANTTSCYNNIFIADMVAFSYLISVAGFPNTAENQLYYNNTFIGDPGCSQTLVIRCGAAGTISCYNNIFYATSAGDAVWTTNVSALALSDYNLYNVVKMSLIANGTFAQGGTVYSSISSWAAALPSACIGKDAHSISVAPTFVGGTPTFPAQKYQLGSSSAGKGTGSTTGTTGGSATDMGAWGGANPPTQIGASFIPGVTTAPPPAVPMAPTLSVG